MLDQILALAAMLAQAAPAPAPTPPRQIIDVRSRPLCTTLHENVRSAVGALLENDAQLAAGTTDYRKMAQDVLLGSRATALLRLNLESRATAIARNLSAADTMLADASRFAADPPTGDGRLALEMKNQLQAVIDSQKLMLNLVNGMVETDALGDMQHEFSSTAPAAPSPPPAGRAAATSAGLPYAPPGGIDPRTLLDTGLLGDTLYGTVAQLLAGDRTDEAKLESSAARTIMRVAESC
ncbi:MAG TPA: hypothetical protein VMF61_13605 [Candidatus Acidoferrales bacterium]|nr:hypothetical protein [Candidatus Acidoferrales bacterium]